MILHVPDSACGTTGHPQPSLGSVPLTARRRRGAYRLAVTARRAAGSDRGRIDDPA